MLLLRVSVFRKLADPSWLLFRFGVFGGVVLASYQVLYQCVLRFGAEWTGRENGPVELSQVVLALIGSVCLFAAAIKSPIGRTGMWISASLLGYAAARECDQLFEHYFFDDAYQWLVGLPIAIVAIAVVWRYRRQVVSDCRILMTHPAAALFAIAGIYLCTVCQMLDRPMLWHSEQIHAAAITPIKTLIEELSELFAYAVLAFAGLESFLLAVSSTTYLAYPRKLNLRNRSVEIPRNLVHFRTSEIGARITS